MLSYIASCFSSCFCCCCGSAQSPRSFWEDIKSQAGNNTMGVIALTGSLGLEASRGTRQGPIFVEAATVPNGYSLTETRNRSGDVAHVYWLPWENRSCQYVRMSDLNNSDCDYFLTSMLSGCRFVATDEYVAHISNEQPGINYQEITTSQAGRDTAEQKILGSSYPKMRRSLSISDVNWGAYYVMDDINELQSYKRAGTKASGSAFVIGYRIGYQSPRWTFKYLKHSLGENHAQGDWITLM